LVRAGLETLPAIIRGHGERASHRFIEFFTASIRNRNARRLCAPGETYLSVPTLGAPTLSGPYDR
jgi:hypothetical protein